VTTSTKTTSWEGLCEAFVISSTVFFFRYSGEVDIGGVLKGNTDQWIQLENAKHGLLHLRFTWLSLSAEINLLNAVSDYLPIFYFCDGANIFI
jgi:hypothetical protein